MKLGRIVYNPGGS